MTRLAAPILTLFAAQAWAATAYVSDELVLGVYAEQNGQGERLATLHSGSSVDTLDVSGEFTHVRLNDGSSGWVKSAYLTTREPAVVRVKQLEEELDRSRATTPELAEAAARSQLTQLQRELESRQSEYEAARASAQASAPGVPAHPHPWTAVPAVLAAAAALGCGFWLGYATLARRLKHKFGGIKVY